MTEALATARATVVAEPARSAGAAGEKPGAPRTKGERTRARLKAAAATVLARCGYHDLRVSDICRAAGVSQGTFYIYFENKHAVTLEIVREQMTAGQAQFRNARTSGDPFLEIYRPTLAYVQLLMVNPGLIRAMLQLVHDDPAVARLWQETTHRWMQRVAANIDRRVGPGKIDENTRMLVAYAMNWMVDGFLHSLVARNDPYMQVAVPSAEHVAETLSVLWYRAVYGADPDPRHLSSADALLRMRLPGAADAERAT